MPLPTMSKYDSDPERALLAQLSGGTVVDGRYRIENVLGRGAMGVVVAATHVHLGERIALKFLHAPAQPTLESFEARFRREAQVSARLRNEHIARVIDSGLFQGVHPYMVMDYLTGVDLRKTMGGGRMLPVDVAVGYAVQICEGMAEAHALGIVHRDLKPSNLFITQRPDGSDLIKILDFGIAKWANTEGRHDELTQTGVVLGSPKYMAPEQLFGSATVDARADIWSIGAILYELLGGRPPYDLTTLAEMCIELASDRNPPSLRERNALVPPALDAVVMQCFARKREERIANVAELAGRLLQAVESPYTEHVRAKIAAVLDPEARDFLARSGSLAPDMMRTYATGSHVARRPGAPAPSFSERTARGVRKLRASLVSPRGRLFLALLLAILIGAVAALLPRSGDSPRANAPTEPALAPAPEPAQPTAPSSPVVTTSPVVHEATVEVVPATPQTGIPTSEDAARDRKPRARPRAIVAAPPPAGVSAKPAAPVAPAAPAAPAARVPPPAAKDNARPGDEPNQNPLEDRQ